jgi:hypothetical protein
MKTSPQTNFSPVYCIFYIKIFNNFLKFSFIKSVPNRLHSAKEEDESSPHPPYSPDLVLSTFHLFGILKGALWHHFADKNELNRSCETKAKSSMRPSVTVSHKGGESVMIMKKTVWKYTNFVNDTRDTCRLYVNCNHNYSFWGGKKEKRTGSLSYRPSLDCQQRYSQYVKTLLQLVQQSKMVSRDT